MTAPTDLVPIRTLCAIYQINANTLRTWERRYGILTPVRTEGGHRGYSSNDVQAIELMLQLLKSGLSPARAAEQVLQQKQEKKITNAKLADFQSRLESAVEALNLSAVQDLLNRADNTFGYTTTVEQLLFPLLATLGNRWHETTTGIPQEHTLSLATKSYLTKSNPLPPRTQPHPSVLIACAPGEMHDFSALHLANLLIESRSVSPLILAAGLPISDIIQCAQSSSSLAVVLSCSLTPRPEQLREWVSELTQHGLERQTILAGPGFHRSRIFSETKFRSAPHQFDQAVRLVLQIVSNVPNTAAN